MDTETLLLDDVAITRILKRISHEIIEKNKGTEEIVLVGIKTRGVPMAKRISKFIKEFEGVKLPVAEVDITFYRDDLTMISQDPKVNGCDIDVEIEDKKVILVDDVLYTGRTVRAAIESVLKNGRASTIQLAVLIDRGHRELPIRADYVGKNIPTSKQELVSVNFIETDGLECVQILR